MTSELTPHQREQLDIATSARIGILTGSAGTGKSFTVSRYLESLNGGFKVCCPTGKAAARLQQEGIPATTIHTMLGPQRNGRDKGGWGFFYNKSMPMTANLVVVDEAFMVSTDLMSDLLSAISPGTRVLFLGDPNQLPPVGHGRPVFDMLDSQVVPHGHLSEVHRYAGRIARVANAIKDGKPWMPSERLDLDALPPENMRHIEAPTANAALDALPKVIEKLREFGFDPIEDVQVICGLNDRGQLSRKILNGGLQAILNPDGERDDAIPFRVGDKIICLRNHMRAVWQERDSGGKGFPDDDDDEFDPEERSVYIANGEQGRVIGLIRSKADKAVGVAVRFCGRMVEIRKDSFSDFDLAFACTCHKVQGSGFPVAIVMIDEGAAQVASRSWHYTAITRAQRVCVTIGRRSTMLTQCLRVDLQNRKTFLKERLMEWGNRNPASVLSEVDEDFLASL